MPRLQTLHPRLLGSAVLATLVFAALPSEWPVNSRLLTTWDVGVLCYLALAWTMAARSSTDMMQQRAAYEDDGAVAVLILTLAAALASLAAIAMELQSIHAAITGLQGFRLSIAAVAILCSWFFMHTIYAIHYAHEYYGDAGERRGLTFPHENKPDYWDFLYFSFNFGAAGQTSDIVVVSKRMRRRALGQTIVSFLFNTTILAFAVNIGAGLL
ncbi:DUF1345 domain-containing protein [Microvirga sp. VF16]|uniref:DUF1345 domain-containing protein n=1 Tax=Microvirga sp. VF16 TaxID=2807101 RepID=UPI00193CA219|nr:DUF1345 domain-containing protein [Microvirga sp. VF16]QRM32548.1 DUF1345 domain-containing protein [Microvirga sp. VF16]